MSVEHMKWKKGRDRWWSRKKDRKVFLLSPLGARAHGECHLRERLNLYILQLARERKIKATQCGFK